MIELRPKEYLIHVQVRSYFLRIIRITAVGIGSLFSLTSSKHFLCRQPVMALQTAIDSSPEFNDLYFVRNSN